MIGTTGIIEVILYVNDMEKMVSFYRDVIGLRVTYPQNVRDYHNEHWVTLFAGACVLALHSGGQKRLSEDMPRIVFAVKDIENARKYLTMRDVPVSAIRIAAPGVLVCDAIDPEGFQFSIEYQENVTDIPSQAIH